MECLFLVRISLLKWKWDKLIMSELLFQKLFINNHGISIDIDKGQEFHGYWCLYTGRKPWEREDMFPVIQFSSVQLLSCVWLILRDPMKHSMPGLPVHHQLLEFTHFMSIESMMPSNHVILYRPLLLPPSIFPSIRVFSNESALRVRWPKYWSYSFSINPSNEHPGLISFRMD